MKTIIVFVFGIYCICSVASAQKLHLSPAQIDSIKLSYKKANTTGLICLPAGGAILITGLVLVASEANKKDDSEQWGGDYSTNKGKVTTGIVLMAGGGMLAAVGILNIVKAKKLKKIWSEAEISYGPTSVPISPGYGQTVNVLQSSISVRLPLFK